MPDNLGKAAEVAERLSNAEGLGNFGQGIGMGIAIVAIFMMVPLMIFAGKWDGRFYEEKECFEFEELEGTMYKLDKCTGELTKIELPDKKPVELGKHVEVSSPRTNSPASAPH